MLLLKMLIMVKSHYIINMMATAPTSNIFILKSKLNLTIIRTPWFDFMSKLRDSLHLNNLDVRRFYYVCD
ncbi:hypothetical protein COSHB9_13660 [Companilactobacillus alimentarius]|nr:hypothetical protein LAL01_14760 [Companilactobacillus alimentarius]